MSWTDIAVGLLFMAAILVSWTDGRHHGRREGFRRGRGEGYHAGFMVGRHEGDVD